MKVKPREVKQMSFPTKLLSDRTWILIQVHLIPKASHHWE